MRHSTEIPSARLPKDCVVVGLCGAARAGKSTVARHLVEHHGFVRLRFADTLKEVTAQILRRLPPESGLDKERLADYLEGDRKQHQLVGLGGATPRDLLTGIGMTGRAIDSRLWVRILSAQVRNAYAAGAKRIVIDDVRLRNEFGEVVGPLGGYMWSVRRREVEVPRWKILMARRADASAPWRYIARIALLDLPHISECIWQTFQVDKVIVNDDPALTPYIVDLAVGDLPCSATDA